MKIKKLLLRSPIYIGLGGALIVMLYPTFWIFMSSFKADYEFYTYPPYALPKSFAIENYTNLLDTSIPLNFRNSLFIAVVTIVCVIILGMLAAYPIAKMRFRGRSVIMNVIMAGIMIPGTASLIPMYSIYNSIGLLNSPWAVIIPQCGFAIPVSMFLCIGFLNQLPDSVIEAAYIDGAGTLRIFTGIIIPMMRNVIITIATFQFVFVWNEFVFARTFLLKPELRTVPLGLMTFVTEHGRRSWGMTLAAICATLLPTLIIFFFLNKQVMKGMAAGAVKQ